MKVESWFLNDKDDVHSSYFMEDIANNFRFQGLEIDGRVLHGIRGIFFMMKDNGNTVNLKQMRWQNISRNICRIII